jgi:hypothetical protein
VRRFPGAREWWRLFPRACEQRRSRGPAAVAPRGGRSTATSPRPSDGDAPPGSRNGSAPIGSSDGGDPPGPSDGDAPQDRGSRRRGRDDGSGRRTTSAPRRRASQSGACWRPTAGDDAQASLGVSGGGSTTLFLCDFVYIYANVNSFYDTLLVHGSPSIFCMFLIFRFTFYINVYCFVHSVPRCINNFDM